VLELLCTPSATDEEIGPPASGCWRQRAAAEATQGRDFARRCRRSTGNPEERAGCPALVDPPAATHARRSAGHGSSLRLPPAARCVTPLRVPVPDLAEVEAILRAHLVRELELTPAAVREDAGRPPTNRRDPPPGGDALWQSLFCSSRCLIPTGKGTANDPPGELIDFDTVARGRVHQASTIRETTRSSGWTAPKSCSAAPDRPPLSPDRIPATKRMETSALRGWTSRPTRPAGGRRPGRVAGRRRHRERTNCSCEAGPCPASWTTGFASSTADARLCGLSRTRKGLEFSARRRCATTPALVAFVREKSTAMILGAGRYGPASAVLDSDKSTPPLPLRIHAVETPVHVDGSVCHRVDLYA